MWNYIIKKTLLSLVFLILIVFILFLLQTQFQGDPYKSILKNTGGGQSYETAKASYDNTSYAAGLTSSVGGHRFTPIERLGKWIYGLFHGDWGNIYNLVTDYKDIPGAIFGPLRTSMLVTLPSYAFGTVLGLGLGILSGYKRGKTIDVFINWFVSIFISIPSFVLAAFAMLIAPFLNLPTIFETAVGLSFMVKTLILPILLLTLISLAGWTYQLRAEIAEILASDYILAARTKGYSEWFIFKRYVLRNALYPFAGALATGFMAIFGSTLIVEKFFNIPGSATIFVSAAKSGEVNLILGNTVIFGLIGLGTSVIADVAQFSINPVVKSAFKSSVSPLQFFKAYTARVKERRKLNQKSSGGVND